MAGFRKRFANSMLIRYAAKGGRKNNNGEANQPNLCKMQRQRDDKPDANDTLRNQTQRLLPRALFAALLVKFMQLTADRLRQFARRSRIP